MMISPKMYIKGLENKTYSELIIAKNKLIDEINDFGNGSEQVSGMKPSPKTIYQVNLQYLAELCNLIASKYSE